MRVDYIGALPLATGADESAADFFPRANRGRQKHGIPETAYLRVIPFPSRARRRPVTATGAIIATCVPAADEEES